MASGVPGTLVMPPTTPATKPATGPAQGSHARGKRGENRVALSATKATTKPPSSSRTVRVGSTTSRRVPMTVPIVPPISSGTRRRIVSVDAPRRANWIPSITMFGRISSTTAVFTSTARLSSGVASVGKPRPAVPFTVPATKTASSVQSGAMGSHYRPLRAA